MSCGHVLPEKPLYISKGQFALPPTARRTAPPRLTAGHRAPLAIPERTHAANSIPAKAGAMCQNIAIAGTEAGSHVYPLGVGRSGGGGPSLRKSLCWAVYYKTPVVEISGSLARTKC
jgi:hypothetical protein